MSYHRNDRAVEWMEEETSNTGTISVTGAFVGDAESLIFETDGNNTLIIGDLVNEGTGATIILDEFGEEYEVTVTKDKEQIKKTGYKL